MDNGESVERKYNILKEFLKTYKKKKIKDQRMISVIEGIVADYESILITLDIKKKGGVSK